MNFNDPSGLMEEAPTFSITVAAPAMGLGDLEFWWAMTRRNWIAEPGGGGGPAPPEPGGGGPSDADQQIWEQILDCGWDSTLKRYGLTAAAVAIGAAGTPIPKTWVPPFRYTGGSPNTTILSVIGHYVRIEVPRLFGTQNVFRIAGRAAGWVGLALMAIDVAVISKDTLECLNKKASGGAESSNGHGSDGNVTP